MPAHPTLDGVDAQASARPAAPLSREKAVSALSLALERGLPERYAGIRARELARDTLDLLEIQGLRLVRDGL